MQTPGLVNPVQQRALVVALVKAQRKAVARTGGSADLLDIGQRVRTVNGGLARTQQVQVGAIEDEDGFHRGALQALRLPDSTASRPERQIMRRTKHKAARRLPCR